jgi:hypothetical protein
MHDPELQHAIAHSKHFAYAAVSWSSVLVVNPAPLSPTIATLEDYFQFQCANSSSTNCQAAVNAHFLHGQTSAAISSQVLQRVIQQPVLSKAIAAWEVTLFTVSTDKAMMFVCSC